MHSKKPETNDFAAAGLAARRRDILRLAYTATMSNGMLTRRLGRWGRLLVPVSGPVQLAIVGTLLPVFVRRGRACCTIQRPNVATQPDRPAQVATFAACIVTWAVFSEILLLLVPLWLYLTVFPGLLVLAMVDVVGDLMPTEWLRRLVPTGWFRHRDRQPAMTQAAREAGAVMVGAVAAYPRGEGGGSALMHTVNRVFDESGTRALLNSRTDELMDWYDRFGYCRTGVGRRMLREPAGR